LYVERIGMNMEVTGGARAAPAARGAAGSRWLVAGMGTLLQVCLGTVYAWSFFQRPIMAAYGWNNAQTMWIFSLAICFLGLAAAWGGTRLAVFGPTRLAVAGGALYGAGYLLSALAMRHGSLALFYVAFGVIGGVGLGLGYVTPVATAARWFPDRKGLVTGMVVMGFGLGALFMSKVLAPALMRAFDGDLVSVFAAIGVAMTVLAAAAGAFLRNPPAGFTPPGFAPPAASPAADRAAAATVTARNGLLSRPFILLWLFFFANICAGIMFIGMQSPMLQDLLRASGTAAGADAAALAAAGATLIAVSSLFNGLGRLFWGGLSDAIGRVNTYRIILASQILVFAVLTQVTNPWLFGALVCYVLLCYGGGFGTAPSTVLTIFGARLMPTLYGVLLTAWSAAGIVGPQIAAQIRDRAPDRAPLFTFAAGALILTFGLLLTFRVSDRPFRGQTA